MATHGSSPLALSFNSRCPYHQRRCKCHINARGDVRKFIASTDRSRQRDLQQVSLSPRFVLYEPLTQGGGTLVRQIIAALAPTSMPIQNILLLSSHVGCSDVVDQAATTLVKSKVKFINQNDTHDRALLWIRAQAFTGLQKMLSPSEWNAANVEVTEQTLCAAAFLSLAEELSGGLNNELRLIHRGGMATMLLALPASRVKESIMVHNFVYQVQEHIFDIPVANGSISPFDRQHWLDIKPPTSLCLRPAAAALRWSAFRLHIRLPRLIKLVRAIRTGGGNFAAVRLGLAIHADLLKLKDDDAEAEMIEQFKIIPTREPVLASIIPGSFAGATRPDFKTAVEYWKGMVILFKLRRYLDLGHYADDEFPTGFTFLRDEALRMSINILKSWQSCSIGFIISPLRASLTSIFCALEDEESFQGEPVSSTRAFLSQMAMRSEEEICEAASVMMGGPIIPSSLSSCSRAALPHSARSQ